jgi:CHAT domain-containing protein
VSYYLAAKQIAAAEGDSRLLGMISLGLYNLYANMADQEVANRYLREAAAVSFESLEPIYRVRIGISLASGCSAERRSPDCTPLFYRAINDSIDSGDLRLLAYCRRMFGNHLLRLGDFEGASASFTEAFRLRLLGRGEDLAYSYLDLGQLRLTQKNFRAALIMSNRALDAASHAPQAPLQSMYHVRALANAGLKRYSDALADFESALDHGRDWRSSVLPTDSARTASSVWLNNIYSDYIATGMRVYARNQSPRLAATMFAAAEENRAVSFRETLFSRTKLPVEYWETLARLRNAERQQPTLDPGAVNRLRLQLAEIEAQTGLLTTAPVQYPHQAAEKFSPEKSLLHCREILSPREALLSFHVGQRESYLWAITPRSFELHVLPGRDAIAPAISRLRAALESSDSNYSALANRLYIALFGSLSPYVQQTPDWIFVLDDPLFDVPFAALVLPGRDGKPVYLAETHSLRVTPAVGMLHTSAGRKLNGTFLAVGDPVFNTADDRWTGPKPRRRTFLGLIAADPLDTPQLNRLAGTAAEIRNSAETWDPDRNRSVILQGLKARRTELLGALQTSPDVVHFATHVVQGNRPRDSVSLTLSLNPSGQPDALGPEELSKSTFQIGLVTLSACSSGAGNSVPGAGLFGLTRAWLLAGAHVVVGTHWPVADDSGELFRPFYSTLRTSDRLNSRTVAHSLRAAQMDMLRSASWRAEPRYWASFFVIGRD